MIKTQHPSNNSVLGAPAGWDQAQLPCDALPVTRTDWNGAPAIVSYWTPTPEELIALAAGAKVALWVVGDTHPPVALKVAP
jgi:hypothetical protein